MTASELIDMMHSRCGEYDVFKEEVANQLVREGSTPYEAEEMVKEISETAELVWRLREPAK